MLAEPKVEAMFDLIAPAPGHFLTRKTRFRLNAPASEGGDGVRGRGRRKIGFRYSPLL